jgi:hypothetical protein
VAEWVKGMNGLHTDPASPLYCIYLFIYLFSVVHVKQVIKQ